MIPDDVEDFHGSEAERSVYTALRGLPDRCTVLFSFRWVHPGKPGRHGEQRLKPQGEGDFVVFDPERGVLVIEVKGGAIRCENGVWLQRNRHTGKEKKTDPEAQASQTKFRILQELETRLPAARRILVCHAVWFADGTIDREVLPLNYHRSTTLDARDLADPTAAVARAFAHWSKILSFTHPPDEDLAPRVLERLAPTLNIVPSVRRTLLDRERRMVQLTREQARIVEFLDEQWHAAVIGAAGTGKTLIAIEKARRVASPDEPVLFLCYNTALGEHLARNHAQANVEFLTFHAFARRVAGPDCTFREAERRLLEYLSAGEPLPYAHVVIDEAQDFESEWLDWLRLRFSEGCFYAFYDRHQAVQGSNDTRWLDEIPCRLVLTKNCRNTDPIARVAYRAAGLERVSTLGLDGPKPVLHRVQDHASARELVERLVAAAVVRHGVEPSEVTVLTLGTLDDSCMSGADRLGGRSTAETPTDGCVTVNTVRRFKGLEASLVIVVDVDAAAAVDPDWRRRLYVACSRARHAVHLVSTTREDSLTDAVRALAGTDKARGTWRALARHLGVRLAGGNDDPFDAG